MNELNSWVMLSCLMMIFLFLYNEDLITCLMSLFFFTFGGSWLSYISTYEFWSVGLLVIVMATGLIVVFAYIVSMNPQKPSSSFSWKIKLMWVLLFIFFSILLFWETKLQMLLPQIMSCTMEVMLCQNMSSLFVSVFLITLLLMLVIYFMRLTYSKGGSLRKKY